MEVKVGHVIHYFNRLEVAVLYLDEELRVGDSIHILGHSTDFVQKVVSMEIEYKKVQSVKSGEVAMKVSEPVRGNDEVYRIVTEEN